MPRLDNAKHEMLAQHIAAGMTGKDAAIAVGYAASRASITASELCAKANVKERIVELRNELLSANHENASYTLAMALKRASAAYDMAKSRKNANAMVAAVSLEAKLSGLLVDKHQDVPSIESLTDSELDKLIAGRVADVAIDKASAPGGTSTVEAEDEVESDS